MLSISGRTFRAIEAATVELSRHGLNVEQFQINVETSPKTVVVIFKDPSAPRTQLGGGPNLPAYEVTVDEETMKIIDVGFSK